MNEPEQSISLHGAVCPVPLGHNKKIVLGHGSGGKMSHDLISSLFLPAFDNPILKAGNDAGISEIIPGIRLAISTDSHVVWPLFFPGGDIGRLAVCGTVNDLAMMGAVPAWLTAGFILEEGLDIQIIERVIQSMHAAAVEANIQIVAGDTKVVQKGKADGLYINTSGVGILPSGISIGGEKAVPGDKVIISGNIGDHGIAVIGARGELGFQTDIRSDIAPLNHLVSKIITIETGGIESPIHVLRDPTRGGLATSLNEIAQQSGVTILIDENQIPIRTEVTAACEMLGFDPLYIANEGKLIAIVDRDSSDSVLQIMKQTKYSENATIIGEVQKSSQARVLMRTAIGTTRIVDVMAGEMLPRIC
jgi:hydrogenase expression/formation protein HypE